MGRVRVVGSRSGATLHIVPTKKADTPPPKVTFVESSDALIVVRPKWRYRFLLDDGRTQDVIADRDDSDLRDAVLTHTKASKIVGVAQLDC